MLDMKFVCPECGSGTFGSVVDTRDRDGPMQRYCHGLVGNRNCGFTWPERDDWRYFLVDGRRPASRLEYEVAMASLRSVPAVAVDSFSERPPKPPPSVCGAVGDGPHGGRLHEWDLRGPSGPVKVVLCENHEGRFVAPTAGPAGRDCRCRICLGGRRGGEA